MRFCCLTLYCLICVHVAGIAAAEKPALTYKVLPRANEVEFGKQLFVDATLTNQSDDPVRVYWGEYANSQMYRFEIIHKESGERIEARRRLIPYKEQLPTSAEEKYFHTIEPGQSVTYMIGIGNRPAANAQYAYFTKPGEVVFAPSFHVETTRIMAPTTGVETDVDDAWTGTLRAEPFSITVLPPEASYRSVTVSGVVLEPSGKPAENTFVQLNAFAPSFGGWDGRAERTVGLATTDQKGHFIFENISKQSLGFRVLARKDGYPMLGKEIENAADQRESIRLQLSEPITIHGRVVDPEGNSIRGARINTDIYTDNEGKFSLISVKGREEYAVSVWKRGYQSTNSTVDAKQAIDGHWEIVLYDSQSLRVYGRARFSDSRPVASTNITFQLKQLQPSDTPNKHWTNLRCTTDERGTFSLVLPDPVAYSAVAQAGENGDHGHWSQSIPKMSPGQNLGYIIFNNRGSILVDISYANEIPAKHTRKITVYSEPNGRYIKAVDVPVGQSQITVDDLSPGEYRVSLTVQNVNAGELTNKITVPDEKPFQAKTTVSVPKIEFGSFKARVVLPDGKTPADKIAFWIDNRGQGRSATTDPNGELLVENIQSGPFSFYARENAGISEKAFTGHRISGNQTLDLGVIRLHAIGEDFGWFKGNLRKSDGEELLARVVGQYAGPGMQMYQTGFLCDVKNPRANFSGSDLDSRFHIQAPAGKTQIAFSLSPAPKGGFPIGLGPQTEQLVASVDIKPGETLHKDLVLPPTDPRTLMVEWNHQGHCNLTVLVKQDAFRWESMLFTAAGKNSQTFDRLPQGKCDVVFSAQNYFAVRSITPDVEQRKIVFDNAVGSISVDLRDAGNKAIGGFGIQVLAALGDRQDIYVASLPPVTDDESIKARKHPKFSERDATGVISGLGPGDYWVKLQHGDWKHESKVSVESDKETALKLRLE